MISASFKNTALQPCGAFLFFRCGSTGQWIVGVIPFRLLIHIPTDFGTDAAVSIKDIM
jgi:hypothetical protein